MKLLFRLALLAAALASGGCATDSLAKARPEAHPGEREFVRELVAEWGYEPSIECLVAVVRRVAGRQPASASA